MAGDEDIILFCHRCGAQLTPGEGNFYVVAITAVADPTPPIITEADLATDVESEIQRIFEEIRDKTEQDLADQVFRRLILHLCAPCYTEWIENPTSS